MYQNIRQLLTQSSIEFNIDSQSYHSHHKNSEVTRHFPEWNSHLVSQECWMLQPFKSLEMELFSWLSVPRIQTPSTAIKWNVLKEKVAVIYKPSFSTFGTIRFIVYVFLDEKNMFSRNEEDAGKSASSLPAPCGFIFDFEKKSPLKYLSSGLFGWV